MNVCIDLRLRVLWFYFGLRLRSHPRTWRWGWPFRESRWANPWLGPLELNAYWHPSSWERGRHWAHRVFEGSLGATLQNRRQEMIRLSFHPVAWHWEVLVPRGLDDSVSIWCGPIWIYASGFGRMEKYTEQFYELMS